ncbi:MAG TPA: hypothetical protein VFE62_15900, partial [Gemmataceae bacterium]|nr:hypothetical protein [Gemmataceae bacterium]
MIVEARAANCFAWTYVLKAKERAVGKYQTQWFSENLIVDLTGRRHLEFRKTSWLGSQFELVDLGDDELIAWCDRTGIFSSSWDLDLNVGKGQLVNTGWFNTSYEFIHDGDALARVDRLGWCEHGWIVDGASVLDLEDLVMIGLVYHTIVNRRQR